MLKRFLRHFEVHEAQACVWPHFQFLRTTISCTALMLLLGCAIWLADKTDILRLFTAPIFYHLFITHDLWVLFIMLVLLCIVAKFKSLAEALSKLANQFVMVIESHIGLVCLGIFIFLGISALFLYHDHPLSRDEYAEWFQSQIFASGHILGHIRPEYLDFAIPKMLQNNFIYVSHATGEVASIYFPGFALLMAPFSYFGVSFLANPCITALFIWVLWHAARDLFGDTTKASWCTLFAIASPVLWGTGISYYSMNAVLLANMLFAWALFKPTPVRLILAGVAGSWALTMHSPIRHILFAIPWWVILLWRPKRFRNLTLLGIGYIPFSLLFGLKWMLLEHYFIIHNQVNFTLVGGVEHLFVKFFSACKIPGLRMAAVRLMAIIKTWAWVFPGILLLAIIGFKKSKGQENIRLFGWSFLSMFLGCIIIYFDQGQGWGFRYIQPGLMALPILATATVIFSQNEDYYKRFAGIFCMLGLILIPIHFAKMESYIDSQLRQLPNYPFEKLPADRKQIVFIPKLPFIVSTIQQYYSYDLVQNDPFMRNNPLYFMSQGSAEDMAFMKKYWPEFHIQSENKQGLIWENR